MEQVPLLRGLGVGTETRVTKAMQMDTDKQDGWQVGKSPQDREADIIAIINLSLPFPAMISLFVSRYVQLQEH